ncbi:MAG TPA: alpha/beta hydrolase [Magnetospirillaceae bacterium]|jgi:pimeloyl-ACP methyl ester carboxylesterase
MAIIVALVIMLWHALPAAAQMDPNVQYQLAPGFSDVAPHGPQNAVGLIIWSHGVNGKEAQYQYPPPQSLRALVTAGWDIVKINRNPLFEQGWITTGQQHVSYVVQQIGAAQQYGYKRVIVAGVSYGGAISLEAALRVPVYGVIAMVPGIGQPKLQSGGTADRNSANIVQYTLAQLKGINASRLLLVMPSDDELLPDVDQSPAVRQLMATRGIPYMLVDQQVHGHGAGYSAAFAPYANCAASFFSPSFAPHAGEFHCYHDELPPVLASFGLNLNGATAAWIGYLDKSAQSVVVVERRTQAGSFVDFGIGGSLSGKIKGHGAANVPATWQGNVLSFHPSGNDMLSMSPNQGSNTWTFNHARVSGGDWAGTLMLAASAR